MNYLLLKFLDVNGVNVFAIYLNTVEPFFLHFLDKKRNLKEYSNN